jgi:hypothetical protein
LITASIPIGWCATTITMAQVCARRANRTDQRFIALGIEIGLGCRARSEGAAVKRPRQRHALRLTGRQRRTLLADLCRIPAHLDDCRARRLPYGAMIASDLAS